MNIAQSRVDIEKLLHNVRLVLHLINGLQSIFTFIPIKKIPQASPFHVFLDQVDKLAIAEDIIDLNDIGMD